MYYIYFRNIGLYSASRWWKIKGLETDNLEEANQILYFLSNKHPSREYKIVRKKV